MASITSSPASALRVLLVSAAVAAAGLLVAPGAGAAVAANHAAARPLPTVRISGPRPHPIIPNCLGCGLSD